MPSDTAPDPQNRRARGRPRGWDDKTEQNTIKSLDRAMLVFEHLSRSQGKMLTELADDLNQSPATVYRVLVTLETRGLVEFDPAEQLWHIGPQAFVIGAGFLRRTSLVERARPILRRLMEVTGETANLGRELDGQVLFLSQVETNATIRAFFPPGTLAEMHSSGIGKVLLAQMSEERIARILADHPMQAFTPNTITDPATLSRELATIRAQGFAIDAEERNEGMRCIAAPVFDHSQSAVAGLSVSGPTSRVSEEKTDEFSHAVIQAARDLSAALGGLP
ncbi:HTH-type transcriptional regulator BhcR [Roseovarius indicus]|uniref:Acetate operon repressor n=1 Tax=Roseovarius indicus TaxID=540747 RepID=A0A0T5P5N7_9RHOB|nr:HTH-type transcriptional regulator BhcR [Roseovarius indicus]KRS16372.1 IclR family transcriptional regulator [Roseovarius indicus]QEW28461.1 Acetate operon repressor [Roseovarius indicus]SFE10376.1 transcriptional regulator, IclR family [Roseovarius indicus]